MQRCFALGFIKTKLFLQADEQLISRLHGLTKQLKVLLKSLACKFLLISVTANNILAEMEIKNR